MSRKQPPDDKKDWLVKSSTLVLGPFSYSEIVQLLKDKTISIFDEVRRPDQRWLSAREHKDFMALILSMRFEMESGEKTVTTATTSGTFSNKTETITVNLKDDSTPLPNPVEAQYEANQLALKKLQDQPEPTGPQKPGFLTGRTFGVHNDFKIQKEIQNEIAREKSSAKIFLIGGLLLAAVFFTGYQYWQNQKKNQDFERLQKSAVRYKSIQLYDLALEEYRKAQSYREPDFATQSEMAEVLIGIAGDTVKGRKILEKAILMGGRSRQRQVDDFIGIGLSYFLEKNYRESEEAFQKAMSYDRQATIAVLNTAYLKMSQNQINEAFKLLDELQTPVHSKHEILKAVAEGLLLFISYRTDNQQIRIDSLLQKYESISLGTHYLRPEILILTAYFQAAYGKWDAFKAIVEKLLNEPVHPESLFVHEPLLIKNWIQGPLWDKVCNEFSNFQAAQPAYTIYVKLVQSICYLNFSNENEAGKIVDELIKQHPRDPDVVLAQLNFYFKSRRGPEAQALIRFAELKDRFLSSYISGRVCMDRGDWPCAQKYFSSMLNAYPQDLYVVDGSAQVFYNLKQRSDAVEMVRRGLDMDGQYLPLLKLREGIENQ